MAIKSASTVKTLDDLLSRLEKAAEANTETGGHQGSSTHPSTDVDDNTEPASEGARSAENTADVKEDQGAPGVDSTAPGTPGGQDSVQLNIGTNQAATGEDPAVETDSAKGGKDDGGHDGPSSHPARTDNDSLDGQKYASRHHRALASIKTAQSAGRQLLTRIVKEADDQQQRNRAAAAKRAMEGDGSAQLPPVTVPDSAASADSPPPGKGTTSETSQGGGESTEPEKEAGQAGGELGDAVATAQQKRAVEIASVIADTIKNAECMADLTSMYLRALQIKQAEGIEDPTAPPPEAGDESGGEESAEGGSGLSEEELLQLLAGGESMGGGQPGLEGLVGEMGGDPGMGGGDPGMGADPGMGGMGADPGMGGGDPGMGADPGMGGGDPGMGADPGMGGGAPGGGISEEDLAMLAEVLSQANVSPEAFEAKAAAKAASVLQQRGASRPRKSQPPKTAEEQAQFRRIQSFVNEIMA